MKKIKLLSILLCLLLVFSGCSGKATGQSYGDEQTDDTLRICVDTSAVSTQYASDKTAKEAETKKFFEALAAELKSACGIEKLCFEILPQEGAERETTLQRLRTEIMAGSGPDVFLMSAGMGSLEFGYDDALFNFPEKSTEASIFLPLDEYMANSTRFTDWAAQSEIIMSAGRCADGQVMIPLTYTFPVLAYPRDAADIEYSSELTMYDVLENPETAELGAVLYSNLSKSDGFGDRSNITILPDLLGKYADFESEELLFTEDEMYNVLVTASSLHDEIEQNPYQYISGDAGTGFIYDLSVAYFDTEMTLLPTYSIDGGATASITAFTAVNSNTKFPEQAFSVIDYIMQENMQRKSELYAYYFRNGLPLQDDLGQQSKPLEEAYGSGKYLSQQYFEDLCKIKETITNVNFQSELDYVLLALDQKCAQQSEISPEDVSEAYEKMERMIGE